MVSIPKVKAKINTVIDKYGNDITINSKGDVVYDDWGEPSYSNQTSVVTVGVTDEYFSQISKQYKTSKIEGADLVLLVKGDEEVSIEHTVLIDGKVFRVLDVKKLKVSNIEVAFELQLGSKQ